MRPPVDAHGENCVKVIHFISARLSMILKYSLALLNCLQSLSNNNVNS